MKNFAIKILISALKLFSDVIVSRINSEWVKKSVELAIKRLTLFGEALVDNNPDDKAQVEAIAKQTLMSPEFQAVEKELTVMLANKISNKAFADLLIHTDELRLKLFASLGDDVIQDGEQVKEIVESFVKTEEFDTIVISFAELLADKYAKNDTMKQFIITLITSLVNSDDEQ